MLLPFPLVCMCVCVCAFVMLHIFQYWRFFVRTFFLCLLAVAFAVVVVVAGPSLCLYWVFAILWKPFSNKQSGNASCCCLIPKLTRETIVSVYVWYICTRYYYVNKIRKAPATTRKIPCTFALQTGVWILKQSLLIHRSTVCLNHSKRRCRFPALLFVLRCENLKRSVSF